MGVIKKKLEITNKGQEGSVVAQIDTGASTTVLNEKFLKGLGLKPVAKTNVLFSAEVEHEKNVYLVHLKIDDCKMVPRLVIGGETNLIGTDILQATSAKIDEEKDTVIFPKCPGIATIGGAYTGDNDG